MILVLLGTHELPFTRLVKDVEELVKKSSINEEVILQHGNTIYESSLLTQIKFISPHDLDDYYDKASFIITHGGVGSITKGLIKKKKVVVCPRLKKFGEHNDDHQLEIAKHFAKSNLILLYEEDVSLKEVIEKIQTFTPQVYSTGNTGILKDIYNFICNN